ncbi:MAG TPA: hypothetical protein VKZ79_13325 [Alphaproteobacteria bacterium]|nr:hypothetical protein [Alphaproteobacteria bacterium]
MAKLQIRTGAKLKKGSAKSVSIDKLRDSDGRIVTVRTIQANSPSLGHDLLTVFKKNVRQARKTNPAPAARTKRAADRA